MIDPDTSGVRETTHRYVSQSSELVLDEPTPTLECATGIVGRTKAMRALRELLDRYATSTATVVILGETGTGKELVARALHTRSRRARMPFVAANVGALPHSMLMSELFGHERGAFTGAYSRHRGLFEQAHGGTLFLDEVGELDPEAQAALLRVLETREVRAVGAERPRTVDVRLVAATHENLAQMVRRGTFREDLFYRLHLLVVEVPALRYRIADVPHLAHHVLVSLRAEIGARTLDPGALAALADYAWPGNVRQLQNVLRRMAVATDARTLTSEHVRAALAVERGGESERREAATTATIMNVLAAEDGNVSRAARRLGLARSTIRAHIRRAGVASNG